MSHAIVVIPTYNELGNIEKVVRIVLSLKNNFHILVVDDNSPDGTADVVRKLASEFPEKIFLEVRSKKSGLGTAYIHGFKWCLKRDYDFIFEMDADLSHNPEDLPRLLKACQNGADMAIGSRYISGVNVVNWPMKRVLLSYFASVYVRLITRMKIQDTIYHRGSSGYFYRPKQRRFQNVRIYFQRSHFWRNLAEIEQHDWYFKNLKRNL
jgi:dolichol-phosphate mannosyltransferase